MTESGLISIMTLSGVAAFCLGIRLATGRDSKARDQTVLVAASIPLITFVISVESLNPFALIVFFIYFGAFAGPTALGLGLGWALGHLGQILCGVGPRNQISLRGLRRLGPPPASGGGGRRAKRVVRPAYDPRWMPTEDQDEGRF